MNHNEDIVTVIVLSKITYVKDLKSLETMLIRICLLFGAVPEYEVRAKQVLFINETESETDPREAKDGI